MGILCASPQVLRYILSTEKLGYAFPSTRVCLKPTRAPHQNGLQLLSLKLKRARAVKCGDLFVLNGEAEHERGARWQFN